jgi:hypothetical protein
MLDGGGENGGLVNEAVGRTGTKDKPSLKMGDYRGRRQEKRVYFVLTVN